MNTPVSFNTDNSRRQYRGHRSNCMPTLLQCVKHQWSLGRWPINTIMDKNRKVKQLLFPSCFSSRSRCNNASAGLYYAFLALTKLWGFWRFLVNTSNWAHSNAHLAPLLPHHLLRISSLSKANYSYSHSRHELLRPRTWSRFPMLIWDSFGPYHASRAATGHLKVSLSLLSIYHTI